MKRWFILWLTAVLFACSATAEMALEDMDLNQLYALRSAVETRIEALEQADGAHMYPNGSYAVGPEMPAGDYTLVERESAMFANVVVRDGPEDTARLVAHNLINGRCSIRLTAGTWVTFFESDAYPLTRAPEVQTDRIGDGGYLVGAQIPEGSYEAVLADKAPLSTYSVYDGILNTGAQLVKFEVLHENSEVALHAGEYVELSGCILRYIEESD